MGEEGVLLRLVEAVDLVDEDDGAAALAPPALLGGAQHLAHLLHPGEDRAHRLEVRLGEAADHEGQGRLARAGRAPEDERAELVLLDRPPEGPAGAEHLLLPEDLVEGARPDPVGERRVGPRLADRVLLGEPPGEPFPGKERSRPFVPRAGHRPSPRPAEPALARRLEEDERGRDPDVEALDRPRERDAQPGGGALEDGGREARSLAPHHEGHRAAEVGLVVAPLAVLGGGQHRDPALLERGERLLDREPAEVGEAEGAAHRAAQRLPREGVGAARGQDGPRGPGRLGGAQQPAQVAGVLDTVRHQHERRPAEDALLVEGGTPGQGEDALRGLGLRERGEQLRGEPPHRHLAAAQGGRARPPRRARPRPAARWRPRRSRSRRRGPRGRAWAPRAGTAPCRPRAP